MKKRLLSALILLTLLPSIMAVEISLSSDNYEPGELLQAEITGNFITLANENILIYKGDLVHSNPVISGLKHDNNIYYFYAILPITEDNYSIRIEDAEETKLGQTKTDTIIKNFTIKETNKSGLSIDPGFVLASGDFTIKIKSLSGNQDVTATLAATSESKTLSLAEDLEETHGFSMDDVTNDTTLTIGSYSIPVFIIDKPDEEPPVVIEDKTELSFLPQALTGNVTLGFAFKVVLANTGTETVENIEISTDSEILLGQENLAILEPNEQFSLMLVIPDTLTEKEFSGTITASFEDQEVNMPFNFELTNDEKQVEVIAKDLPLLTCEDLEGTICKDDEKCSVNTIASTEQPCCPESGKCKKIKTSNTGTIIGFVMIGAVITMVIYFYLKGRKRLKPKSTDQILKEKQGKFNERMKSYEPSEVSGKLSKD